MQHESFSKRAPARNFAFQGLIQNEGRSFANWGLHRTTTPAIFAEPISYGDVQALVSDVKRFPSPVSPVGSMLSTSATVVNDGGTVICLRKLDECLRKLDEVLGVERDAAGREVVRVQAGCRLKKLNSWLQARGLEIPFQAEIGEATVGSAAAGDTKESSLDAPGYFSAHVTAVSYVDESGALRVLSDLEDQAAFFEFKCSFGLSGIIVECCVETRPATLCRSDVSIEGFASPASLAAALLKKRSQCDALLALVFLPGLGCFFDQRFKAGPGAHTPPESQPGSEEFRLAKRLAIQHGFEGVALPEPKGLIYSRADFVNEYWRPAQTEPRLDFQYYEHDISQLERVVTETYEFTRSFQEMTGFAPRGWATYFVQRPERETKPFGLYSSGPGVSLSFDPVSSNPADPLWQQFAREYNGLAIHKLGAKASPIQTQWLKRGDVKIPRKLAKPRFTTPYYAQFLV